MLLPACDHERVTCARLHSLTCRMEGMLLPQDSVVKGRGDTKEMSGTLGPHRNRGLILIMLLASPGEEVRCTMERPFQTAQVGLRSKIQK